MVYFKELNQTNQLLGDSQYYKLLFAAKKYLKIREKDTDFMGLCRCWRCLFLFSDWWSFLCRIMGNVIFHQEFQLNTIIKKINWNNAENKLIVHSSLYLIVYKISLLKINGVFTSRTRLLNSKNCCFFCILKLRMKNRMQNVVAYIQPLFLISTDRRWTPLVWWLRLQLKYWSDIISCTQSNRLCCDAEECHWSRILLHCFPVLPAAPLYMSRGVWVKKRDKGVWFRQAGHLPRSTSTVVLGKRGWVRVRIDWVDRNAVPGPGICFD